VLIGGGIVLLRPRRCEPERQEMERRRSVLREAQAGLDQAQRILAEQRERVTELRTELAALERAAASSTTIDGRTYHRIAEGTVTADGLADITATVASQLAEAEAVEAENAVNVESWQEKVDRYGAEARHAERAYNECIEAAATPAPVAGGEPTPAPPGGPSGGPAVVVDPADEPGGCIEGTKEMIPAGPARSIRVIRDVSLIVEVVDGSGRAVDTGRTMASGLGALAGELGTLGSLLGGAGAGTAVSGGVGAMTAGSYVKGSAGLVAGGAQTYIAGADPNIGTESFPVSIPTSPQEAVTEFLEATARLGELVASKVSDWMEGNQLYTARITYFEQQITATPHHLMVCRGGRMVCAERVYVCEVGNLTRRAGPSATPLSKQGSMEQHKFAGEIRRLSSRARSDMRSSIERRVEFDNETQPGPCQS
jgi:hypothetical protein